MDVRRFYRRVGVHAQAFREAVRADPNLPRLDTHDGTGLTPGVLALLDMVRTALRRLAQEPVPAASGARHSRTRRASEQDGAPLAEQRAAQVAAAWRAAGLQVVRWRGADSKAAAAEGGEGATDHRGALHGCLCAGGTRVVPGAAALGEGAFGAVFGFEHLPCRHLPQEAPIAVKVELLDGAAAGGGRGPAAADVVAALHNARRAGEAGVAPRLFGAYVCVHRDGRAALLTLMEAVQGEPLREWLASRRPLGQELRVRALLQRAVGRLNRAGILHGDLHAGNVMVLPGGAASEVRAVKLVDFGQSRACALAERHDAGLAVDREVEGEAGDTASTLDCAVYVACRLVAEGVVHRLALPPAFRALAAAVRAALRKK